MKDKDLTHNKPAPKWELSYGDYVVYVGSIEGLKAYVEMNAALAEYLKDPRDAGDLHTIARHGITFGDITKAMEGLAKADAKRTSKPKGK